jgi:hypothetical protein
MKFHVVLNAIISVYGHKSRIKWKAISLDYIAAHYYFIWLECDTDAIFERCGWHIVPLYYTHMITNIVWMKFPFDYYFNNQKKIEWRILWQQIFDVDVLTNRRPSAVTWWAKRNRLLLYIYSSLLFIFGWVGCEGLDMSAVAEDVVCKRMGRQRMMSNRNLFFCQTKKPQE